jgi:hypothetical protein
MWRGIVESLFYSIEKILKISSNHLSKSASAWEETSCLVSLECWTLCILVLENVNCFLQDVESLHERLHDHVRRTGLVEGVAYDGPQLLLVFIPSFQTAAGTRVGCDPRPWQFSVSRTRVLTKPDSARKLKLE